MTYLLLKFAHILGFVYWLGGDLGTFVASGHTVRRDISPESRAIAMKIMLACDQGPKMAMPLMLPLGLHMASMTGLVSLSPLTLAGIWLLSLLWLGNVLVLYFAEGQDWTKGLAKADLGLRIVVVLALLVAGIAGLSGVDGIAADWVAWKLLIFAGLISCGIMIRIRLRPFIPAFMKLMTEGPDDSINTTLEQSLAACRPWVYLIWVGLFVSAAIGIHLIA